MTTQENYAKLIETLATEVVQRFILVVPMPGESAYDTACRRFGNAGNAYQILSDLGDSIMRMANDEYDAAQADLAEYEDSPGIAKAEYR